MYVLFYVVCTGVIALRKGHNYLANVGITDDAAAVRKETTMLRNTVTKSTLPQDAEFEIEED